VPSPHASVWWATLPSPPPSRPALPGDLDVDVAIVGGGFTGLWTAIGLLRGDPSLRVAVLEATVAGAGASGRNGGWASALYPLSFTRAARVYGEDAMRRLRSALRAGVVDLGADGTAEGVDFDFHRGGTVTLARTPLQTSRLIAEIGEDHALGDTDEDVTWLDAVAAQERVGATGVLGAMYTPHCAAVHPAKLVTGLALAAERRGATIYEGSPVISIEPGDRWQRARAVTDHGTVRADVVVRATEGFTTSFADARRSIVPLYSLVISTEPLGGAFFDRVGLAERETFNDARHLLIYGQRTADDRLVFGGRGAPYHFGSRVDPSFDSVPGVFDKLAEALGELFGELPAGISHRWGGPVAMPRDQSPYVRLDRARGVAAAGGYVGDGVVLSRIAALSMADVILGVDSEYASLPFVGHLGRNWEPEPLRWVGINVGIMAAQLADHREAQTGRRSMAAAVLKRIQGDH